MVRAGGASLSPLSGVGRGCAASSSRVSRTTTVIPLASWISRSTVLRSPIHRFQAGRGVGLPTTMVPTRYSRAKRRMVSAMSSPLYVKTIAPSCLARVRVPERMRCVCASMTVGSSEGVCT